MLIVWTSMSYYSNSCASGGHDYCGEAHILSGLEWTGGLLTVIIGWVLNSS